jgi:hypothetical protein
MWIRLDSMFASNPKVLHLLGEKGGDHALLVFTFGLGYCGVQGQDGFIPRAAPGTFHGRPRDIALLESVGMWEPVDGGWNVHDWAEYQPSSEESRARSDKARKAAAARWGKRDDASS